MSGYTFAIHHIIAKEVYDTFGGGLNDLFGGPENNPFHVDAVTNKIALASDEGFADAISKLDHSGSTLFSEINIGNNAHLGGHGNYNTFQRNALSEILDPDGGLTDAQKKGRSLRSVQIFEDTK